jgi:hypothetical protein
VRSARINGADPVSDLVTPATAAMPTRSSHRLFHQKASFGGEPGFGQTRWTGAGCELASIASTNADRLTLKGDRRKISAHRARILCSQ